jgi:hypothetical protein
MPADVGPPAATASVLVVLIPPPDADAAREILVYFGAVERNAILN